jgi:hypothetical protein
MSRPRPLPLRLVRFAAGLAVALPAVGLYGASGAWADKPVSPGNSANAAGHAAAAAPAAAPAPAKAGDNNNAKANDNGNAKANDNNGAKANDNKKAAPAEPVVTTNIVASVTSANVATVATVTTAAKPGKSDHSNGNASTVGSVKSPQPLSNADKNPGGANNGGNCGAYCSTRDGSPSLNGNGNGGAGGKPCAGCVGKADNKNPKGQAPNGSDHNNGYECDGNNGIGKGNPAHTACSPRPTPTPSPTPSCVPSSSKNNHNAKQCPPPPSGSCTENSFFGTQSPARLVVAGDVLSVVYDDETPIGNGVTAGKNGIVAPAPFVTIDGVRVGSPTQTSLGGNRVRLTFVVPNITGTHTISMTAYDTDQNKAGGDCGVATWHMASPPDCTVTGGCSTGGTTGTTTGGTTGTTTGGTTGTTTGGTTGATTGGTTGITTGGSTGGQTSGGTTGLVGGTTGGAQGTTGGVTCPAAGSVGPMPAGCPTSSGGDNGGGALPFTGMDLLVLVAIAAIAGGLGLGLTAAAGLGRRPQA